jgi:hypothetical protein
MIESNRTARSIYMYKILETLKATATSVLRSATSAVDRCIGQRRLSATAPPEGLNAYFTGIRMGPRASLDRCGEYLLHPPGLEPRMVQHVASRIGLPTEYTVLILDKFPDIISFLSCVAE